MSLDKTFRALRLDSGAVVTKFDTDGTMAGNSDVYVPTQKAVKTYVDGHQGALTQTINLSGVTIGTSTTGTFIKMGLVGTPYALNTPGQSGVKMYVSTTATSDTTYGQYIKLSGTGAGAELIGLRSKASAGIAGVGNAHGAHFSMEFGASAGDVAGLATAVRGNVVVPNRAIAQGTYYGSMAEIFAEGNTSALPTASNACLGINLQAGTAMDLVGNAISFSGTDGTGKMIVSATDAAPDWTGSIRILVNGAKRYIHFTSAEAA
jgi:hypothetical protein